MIRWIPTCQGCTVVKVTAEGARPCSFYDCPKLPKELEVVCEKCAYDFSANGTGTLKCDHGKCSTAARLIANVPGYKEWLKWLKWLERREITA